MYLKNNEENICSYFNFKGVEFWQFFVMSSVAKTRNIRETKIENNQKKSSKGAAARHDSEMYTLFN